MRLARYRPSQVALMRISSVTVRKITRVHALDGALEHAQLLVALEGRRGPQRQRPRLRAQVLRHDDRPDDGAVGVSDRLGGPHQHAAAEQFLVDRLAVAGAHRAQRRGGRPRPARNRAATSAIRRPGAARRRAVGPASSRAGTPQSPRRASSRGSPLTTGPSARSSADAMFAGDNVRESLAARSAMAACRS